jgi:hypothetical protein
MGPLLAVTPEVRANVRLFEPSSFTDTNRTQLARAHEPVDAPPRDPQEAGNVSDREEVFWPIAYVRWRLEMCVHDATVPRLRRGWTSAELSRFDSQFDSPWEELRVCRQAVLGDWDDVPVPDEIARECRRHSVQRVRAAALRVEKAVQDRLWGLGGPGTVIGDARYARALHDAQWQAHSAVVAKTGSRKRAKILQQHAARERPPLTVCCGKQLRRLPEEVLRYNASDLLEHYEENIVPLGPGDGCWSIIPDSTECRAPKRYCDRCAAKAGNTMNAGLAKNALARLRASRKRR